MFHTYEEWLDVAVLGMLEVDSGGDVNLSRRGPVPSTYVGAAGAQYRPRVARTVVFVGSFRPWGLAGVRGARRSARASGGGGEVRGRGPGGVDQRAAGRWAGGRTLGTQRISDSSDSPNGGWSWCGQDARSRHRLGTSSPAPRPGSSCPWVGLPRCRWCRAPSSPARGSLPLSAPALGLAADAAGGTSGRRALDQGPGRRSGTRWDAAGYGGTRRDKGDTERHAPRPLAARYRLVRGVITRLGGSSRCERRGADVWATRGRWWAGAWDAQISAPGT